MLHLNKTTQFRKKIFLAIAVIFLSSCIFVQNSSLVSASAGWTAGKFDKSYDFNGQFYIDAGSVSSGVKTVAFWTKATAYDGKVVDLNGSAYVSISSSGVISTTGFTSPTIYIDGVIGTTVNANWHFVTVTTGTAINANAVKFGSVDSDSIVGLLDDVKMYNYALSAREINEKYRQDSPSMAQGGEITGSSAYTALTVTQNGTGQIVSLTNTATATAAAFTSTNLGSGNSLVINDEAGDTTPFVIDASGRVGIGTASPTEQLTLTGNIALSSSTSATSGLIKKGTDLLLHTYGTNSTFLGVNAGNLTLTGAGNVGVGYNSLTLTTTGEDNTAIGIWTLSSNTTGSYNTAIGPFSLYDNTEGADNVAVGMNSLADNISGDSNTAVGVRALNENTAGNNNTATGNRSLMHATGNDNSAFGHYALFSSIGGSGNSAFGRYSLYDNTTGSNNTAVGYNTGLGITTGANNTIIGANVSGLATGLSNTIILADGSGNKRLYVNSSGNVGIGTTTPHGRMSISADSTTGIETNVISIDDYAGYEVGGIRTYNSGTYNQDMRFYVAYGVGTPTVYNAMTIVGETGNVGIGTADPSAKLTIQQDGTGDIFDLIDAGVSIFKVGQATVDITRPLDLQVEGDVGIEYNLQFMNNASSYITSAGPLILSAGDTNSYENLTLTTGGTGDVVIDIAGSTLGLKVVGAASQVFSIDPSGNVMIGGTDSGDGNLTVKGNISTQGGNLDLNSLSTPSSVAVAPVGTAGSTTYGYRISAINDNGQTLASATTTTTTGNATLSSTNYNRVSWGAVAGATGYKVYGRTSGSELLMATVDSPVLMYKDTNANTPSGALPTTNTTGGNNITYAATNGPKRSIILTAAGAETPTSNGAAQTKVTGTNHTYYVLDFDTSTDESAYWHWTMPDSYDGGAIDITYYWEAAVTSGTVSWCFQVVGIAANSAEDIDTELSSAICEVDTAQGNANDVASVTETQATSNFAAGEYIAFKVFRDVSADNMAGDARLLKVKIEYSVNAESD